MRKAHGKGRGRADDGACRGRGRGAGETMPAAVAQPKLQSKIPTFLSNLTSRRRPLLLKPEHSEEIVGWMADNASTSSVTTPPSTQSSLTRVESGPHNPHPDPSVSHHSKSQNTSDRTLGHSEELFSFPFPDSGLSRCTVQEGHEEIICSDAQILEEAQSEKDNVGEWQLPFQELHDETQLPATDDNVPIQMSTGDQSEDVEDELVDDEVTDPTWEGAMHSEDSSAEGEGSAAPQQAGRGSGVSQRVPEPGRQKNLPKRTPTRKVPLPRVRCSPVWRFFVENKDDKRIVICNLCHANISRGLTTTSLTTTSMLRHMSSKHPTHWAQRLGPQSLTVSDTTASSPVLQVSHPPVLDAGVDASRPTPVRVPLPTPSASTSTVSQFSVQQSIPQAFERKRKYPATHPQSQILNSHISRMLALEMLPFKLVESESFRSLMAAAVPRYSVPSRHYFSRSAVPALHQHVSHKISRALTNAVTGKVHLTTDTWTSSCGQGRYISLTAHWVNVVEAGTESNPGTTHVLPTPRIAGPTSVRVSSTSYTSACTLSSSSSSSSSILSSTSMGSWKHCSTALGKRQQALLKLICLGDKQHTAAELWKGITDQTDLWLSPLNLQPGMVVCDNGRNLVAALHLGKLTHIPCLAHVLNLVVQRFLKTYPDLPELLVKVRRVCAHFRKSPTASAGLTVLQQRLQVPAHRLVCDVTTRWNSTLHMLERLCEQKSTVVEYQLQNARRHSGQPPHISSDEWAWMSDICDVLRNFEECTKMVSGDDAIISVTIPLLCLLKCSLLTIKEEALRVDHVEMEDDSILHDSQPSLVSSSQHTLSDIDEEEEEEDQEMFACTTEGSTHTSLIPSIQRGWADEEEEREDEDIESLAAGGDREVLPVGSLAHMADFMYCCLSRDPRVIRILDNNEYWIFTLLDPRYKEKFASLLPAEQVAVRMQQYQKALVDKMLRQFPSDNVGGGGHSSLGTQVGDRRETHTRSDKGKGRMSKVWDTFITSPQRPGNARGGVTRREKFWKMVKEYLADRTIVLHDSSVPYNYWVSKLDTWHELSLYALEVLACPAASVLSERVFSAAGGIITDKRIRLSTENADRLTLIKMNKAWIGEDFCTPPDDSSGT